MRHHLVPLVILIALALSDPCDGWGAVYDQSAPPGCD